MNVQILFLGGIFIMKIKGLVATLAGLGLAGFGVFKLMQKDKHGYATLEYGDGENDVDEIEEDDEE